MVWVLFCKYPIFKCESYIQLLEDESGRADEFYNYLRRIEFQAIRIVENPIHNLRLNTTQVLMQEKSIHLLIAIVTYFNSALLYFSHDFFGKTNYISCLTIL